MLSPGTQLVGRYEIVRLIAHGGTSLVYLGKALALGDAPVAIKEQAMQFPDPAMRSGALMQFKQEASILARLSHPGIVGVKDCFPEGDSMFIVLEHIDGRTLNDIVLEDKRNPPVPLILHWGLQLCDILMYLHGQQMPVLVRDLKPENVMMDRRGRLRLIDFGLARLLEPNAHTATLVRGAGTPGYAPPEQYSGQTEVRSDIYALGATLFALLTGRVPPDSVAVLSGTDALPPVSSLRSEVTPAVDQVVARMMAPVPDSRYHSIAEAGKALTAAVRTVPPHPYNSAACLVCGAPALPPDRICRNCIPIDIPTAEVIPVKNGPPAPSWKAALPAVEGGGEAAPVPEDRKVRLTLTPPPSLSRPLPARDPLPPDPEPAEPRFPLLGVMLVFGVLVVAGGLLFLLRFVSGGTPHMVPSGSPTVALASPSLDLSPSAVPSGPDAPPMPSSSPEQVASPSPSPSTSASASAAPSPVEASPSAAAELKDEKTPAGTYYRPADWEVQPQGDSTPSPGKWRTVFLSYSSDKKYFNDVQMYDGMTMAATLKAIQDSVKDAGGNFQDSARQQIGTTMFQIYDLRPKAKDGAWSSTNYLCSGKHATIRYEFAWAKDADSERMADLARQVLARLKPQD